MSLLVSILSGLYLRLIGLLGALAHLRLASARPRFSVLLLAPILVTVFTRPKQVA